VGARTDDGCSGRQARDADVEEAAECEAEECGDDVGEKHCSIEYKSKTKTKAYRGFSRKNTDLKTSAD